MLIDFHTHLFPDTLAAKALGKLSSICGLSPVTDGTVSDSLIKFDEWGVDRAVVLHIATSPHQQQSVNRFAQSIQSSRLISFGSVHFESEDALRQLDALHQAGLQGIKLHPDYQGFDADDRRVYPIYERAQDLGLCCSFHAGFDPLSPQHIHCTPAMLKKIHQNFPALKMICAHLGGMRLWEAVEEELCGHALFLDTAFIAGAISPRQAARIISRHGSERVLFGSDCPWQKSCDTFSFIDSLPLTDREKENIFSRNALQLLGLLS